MFVLQDIHTTTEEDMYKVTVEIKSDIFKENTIWFAVDRKFKDCLTVDRYDAFLVAMLYPAMMYGEDIKIEGNVSLKLYWNIVNYVQAILVSYSPQLKRIRIDVNGLYDETIQSLNHTGTGFSGGVDSFCTIYDHFVLEIQSTYKIDALVFLNVGSHGRFSDKNTENKFLSRYDYLRRYTDSIGLPFILVDSNIHHYHAEWGHTKTVSLTTASGILILQNFFSVYYISSAISYNEMMLYGEHSKDFDLAEYSEPYLLPRLSTESLEFIPDGQQYSRTQKTIHIAEYAPVKIFLNVCINRKQLDEKNCSVCQKCLRTLMTLESAGKLRDFAEVFDLKKYQKKSFQYRCLQRLKYHGDPFAKDNIDFARENGRFIPPYFISAVVCLPYVLQVIVKILLKKILKKERYNKLKLLLSKSN